MTLSGACHCGATRFEVAHPPATVTRCNCSICSKRGALWAYYAPQDFRLLTSPQAVAAYSWGDRSLDLNFCPTCGCSTFNDQPGWTEPERHVARPDRKIGVNARLFEAFDLDAVPVRLFDGRAM